MQFLALRFSEHHWHVGTSRETKWGTGDHIRTQKKLPDAYKLFVQALKTVNLAGIVTTNYDIVFEKILGPISKGRLGGFHYGTPGEKLQGRHPERGGHSYTAPPLTGAIPLLKLHGSLNLQLNCDGPLRLLEVGGRVLRREPDALQRAGGPAGVRQTLSFLLP